MKKKIKICLWQYRPSLHQLALVEALSKKCDLTWVIEKKDLVGSRSKMGWNINSNVHFINISSFELMVKFISKLDEDIVHIFGGFRSSNNLEKILENLINRNKRVFVQTESFRYVNLRGLLGVLKFYFNRLFLNKYNVEGIFAMGNLGVNFFSSALLRFDKVMQFGYFTVNREFHIKQTSDIFKIVFVGQHVKRKGIDLLFKAIKNIEDNFKLYIIGDGQLNNYLKEFVVNNHLQDKVIFLGNLDNDDVLSYISTSDLLVLPSRFDGWGAVVSEALMQGTPVVTSDKCGSSVLINNSERGAIIRAGSVKQLHNAIIKQISKGKITIKKRQELIQWSECISGNVAAQYMIDCINDKKPKVPWID